MSAVIWPPYARRARRLCGSDIDVLSACIVYANERIPPKSEVCIALAGPLFNLLGALAGSLLLLGVRSTPVLLFVAANLFFAFVNLIPVRGTDGGSALFYALLQSHPPETCARVCAVAAGVARAVFALLFVLSLYATAETFRWRCFFCCCVCRAAVIDAFCT